MANGVTFYVLTFLTTIIAALVVFLGATSVARLRNRVLLLATIPVLFVYIGLCVIQPSSWLLSDIVVLLTAILVGSLLSTIMGSAPAIVGFIVSAAVVDFFSFSGGLTERIISGYRSGESLLLQYLCVSVPIGGEIVPVVGIGDFIILSVVFFAFKRLGYPAMESFLVPLTGLLVALVVGLIVHGIYALSFVAMAVVGYLIYKRRRQTTDEESGAV